MASVSRYAPRWGGNHVCCICRNTLRPLQRAPFKTARTFGTASLLNCDRITRNALLQCRRQPSYSTTTFAPRPSSSGIAPLPHRRLIALSGPDAAKFLQGLITNNVDPTHQTSFYSAFLDARGRVLLDVFVWVWPELYAEKGHWGCYVEVDEAEVETLKKHLKKHKLRSKITIEEVNDKGETGVKVWAAWGSMSESWSHNVVVAKMKDPRAPDMHRYLARADFEHKGEGTETSGAEAYHLQRYRCGIPEGPHEIPRESALPMECNIDLNRGIDFQKGCYVGQELTIRTKHTGIVRKRILPVSLHTLTSTSSSPHLEHGAEIKVLDEMGSIKKGRAAGKFIAGVGNVGLALCRLENMTSMKVSAEGGSWKSGMEFGIESNGEIIKVKPLLYDWFVLRERDLWDKNRTRI